MRQVLDLGAGKIRRWRGLGLMALFQERPDRAAIAIVEDDQRADEVGSVLAAAGGRAVAGDALGDIDFFAAFGRFGVDYVLIGRAGLGEEPAVSPAASRA